MSADSAALEPFTGTTREAWAFYIEQTQDARERYVETLAAANVAYDLAKAAAEVASPAAIRHAWELRENTIAEAWLTYASETKADRQRRDFHLSETLQLAAEQ